MVKVVDVDAVVSRDGPAVVSIQDAMVPITLFTCQCLGGQSKGMGMYVYIPKQSPFVGDKGGQ